MITTTKKAGIGLQIIMTLLFFVVGCHKDEHDHPHLTTGKQLFEFHCSACHRQDGNGKFLKGYPSIANTEFLSWEITHKIRGDEAEGRNMPSFKNMPVDEATAIAKYLKSLNN